MARRIVEAAGVRWGVSLSGSSTQYGRDEFGLVFRRLDDNRTEARVIRYSPCGINSRELSLARMSDDTLRQLLSTSQPSWTAPELGYRR